MSDLLSRLRAGVVRRWSSSSLAAVEATDEEEARRKRGTVPITAVVERERVVLSGILQSVTYSPEGMPTRLLAVLYDGTGTIELRWPGRHDIPGVSVGRRIEVEGSATRHHGRLVIVNPLYRLLAPESR